MPFQIQLLCSSFTPLPNSVFPNCDRFHTFPWANISLLLPLQLCCEPTPIPSSQGESLSLQSYVDLSQSKSVQLIPLLWTRPTSQFGKLSFPKANSHSLDFGYSCSLFGFQRTMRTSTRGLLTTAPLFHSAAGSHSVFQEALLDPECSSQDESNSYFFPAASPNVFKSQIA